MEKLHWLGSMIVLIKFRGYPLDNASNFHTVPTSGNYSLLERRRQSPEMLTESSFETPITVWLVVAKLTIRIVTNIEV